MLSNATWRERALRILVLPAALIALVGADSGPTTPALVVDVATGQVLHDEAAGHPWYPASTTKLMTALLAFEALAEGTVTMETPVVMSANAMDQSFIVTGLKIGSTMRLEDALYAAIAASANEVAVALAETIAGSEKAFVASMNATAKRLGMTATHFRNPSGLFDKKHQSSARDLAILGMEVAGRFPQYGRFFRTARVVIDGKQVDSNNVLLTRYAGTTGMKTGFLCASGRNIVALAEREGRQIMVVLLGATTERERNERAAKFFTEAFAGQLSAGGEMIAAVPNDPDAKAPDMRRRLCGEDAPAYEAARDLLFPWGLPDQPTYLGPAGPIETRLITTWKNSPSKNVPVPTPRPTQ
jgi:D-alanyl-D-alanine carboxypeptidase